MHLRRYWPHVPLAILVFASGILNLVGGLGHVSGDLAIFNAAATYDSTLAIFGRSTQAILGAGLALCGIGLFWRLRTPWAFALLLSFVTVGLDVMRHEWNAALIVPALMFVGLIVYRNVFRQHAVAINLFISIVSIATVVGYGTLGTFFMGSGFRPAVTHMSTALYFTIVTLSTVGYGDIVPVTTQTRLFAISLIVFGIAIFATAIATTFGPAITTEIGRIFQGKERPVETTDHFIVVGDGEIAEHAAAALETGGNQVLRIGSNEALEREALENAHVQSARMVIAASDDDNKNAVISLIVKDMNPSVRVVAAAGSTASIRRLILAHADAAFAPTVLGGRLLAQVADGKPIPPEFSDLLGVQPATKP